MLRPQVPSCLPTSSRVHKTKYSCNHNLYSFSNNGLTWIIDTGRARRGCIYMGLNIVEVTNFKDSHNSSDIYAKSCYCALFILKDPSSASWPGSLIRSSNQNVLWLKKENQHLLSTCCMPAPHAVPSPRTCDATEWARWLRPKPEPWIWI